MRTPPAERRVTVRNWRNWIILLIEYHPTKSLPRYRFNNQSTNSWRHSCRCPVPGSATRSTSSGPLICISLAYTYLVTHRRQTQTPQGDYCWQVVCTMLLLPKLGQFVDQLQTDWIDKQERKLHATICNQSQWFAHTPSVQDMTTINTINTAHEVRFKKICFDLRTKTTDFVRMTYFSVLFSDIDEKSMRIDRSASFELSNIPQSITIEHTLSCTTDVNIRTRASWVDAIVRNHIITARARAHTHTLSWLVWSNRPSPSILLMFAPSSGRSQLPYSTQSCSRGAG